ncbi:MAG: CAAD domain-containing protein [Cyanobium usitatum Tobar12.5m-G36]|nr:CAAD domain-containing protein [Cyanobium usitatum Tobar12.5m-G36]
MADDTTTNPDGAVQQPAPEAAPPEPSIAATLVIEASPSPGSPNDEAEPQSGEGGEWELLLGKLRQWLDQNELNNLWAQARKPVTLLAGLVGLLLVVRVYSAVLGALDSLPLVPGLLELAGVVWTVRYGIPKLLRSSERERLLGGLSQSWKAFRGKA